MKKYLLALVTFSFCCAFGSWDSTGFYHSGVLPYRIDNSSCMAYCYLEPLRCQSGILVYRDTGTSPDAADRCPLNVAAEAWGHSVTVTAEDGALKADRRRYLYFPQQVSDDYAGKDGVWVQASELLKATRYARKHRQDHDVSVRTVDGKYVFLHCRFLQALVRDEQHQLVSGGTQRTWLSGLMERSESSE